MSGFARPLPILCLAGILAACGSSATGSLQPGSAAPPGASQAAALAPAACAATPHSAGPGPAPYSPAGLHVPAGFRIETIARMRGARELVALPNGDVLVGTSGTQIFIVPHAEAAGAAGDKRAFATIDDAPDAGVAFSADRCEIYFGTQYGVYKTAYRSGDLAAERVVKIAAMRTCPSGGCRSDHETTSVAYANGIVYAAAGSDCNACVETDPTRAAISQMSPDGSGFTVRATRIRNAIALAIDPQTGHLWAGGAGQDALPAGHPYEYLDDVSAHPGVADYGWPACEENHRDFGSGADCSHAVAPLAELPAYSTIVGAAFYPQHPPGRYAFPPPYRGALLATSHGSWHLDARGCSAAVPKVVWFPMNGDAPKRAVNWNDPSAQWHWFAGGFQTGCTSRHGRPTGIAVGPQGSLFVSDDRTSSVYRIRYAP